MLILRLRKAAYHEALQVIVEEAPWVFLYNPSEIFAYGESGSRLDTSFRCAL